MTNEQITAMATWTLEDFQEDPLAAIERVRELATAYQVLRQERDAVLADLYGQCCKCKHFKNGLGYCDYCDQLGGTVKNWEWRSPQPEQVLAPADQSAGEYADNPVLAQA